MKVFSVFGVSKSGKTTTIEEIIKELSLRGYSVGSIKEIHFEQFAIDENGTNTDRHRKAGSQLVTARGLHETDVLFSERLPVDKILEFYDHDFVILEGVTDFNVPKIICAHNKQEIDERLDPTVFALSGVITEKLNRYKGLPVFDALKNTQELVDYIEAKVPHVLPNIPKECYEECKIDQGIVKLFIGDEEIKMVPFVKDILAGTVKGFISNLNGYKSGREITIKIYPEKE